MLWTDPRMGSLILGGILFYLIESNFDINGFWNHTPFFAIFLLYIDFQLEQLCIYLLKKLMMKRIKEKRQLMKRLLYNFQ